jgi:hypothetical protein
MKDLHISEDILPVGEFKTHALELGVGRPDWSQQSPGQNAQQNETIAWIGLAAHVAPLVCKGKREAFGAEGLPARCSSCYL